MNLTRNVTFDQLASGITGSAHSANKERMFNSVEKLKKDSVAPVISEKRNLTINTDEKMKGPTTDYSTHNTFNLLD